VRGATFAVGDFLNALISFLLVSGAVYFFVVLPMNALHARMKKGESVDPSDKQCPECLSKIPLAAKRCAFCAQAVA
jgi:large conductance mechanosensitive channel